MTVTDLDGGAMHTTHAGHMLYVKTWATKEAPKAILLALHGLGEHCNRYKHVFGPFAEAGIQTTAFDLRGHGRSPGARGDAGSMNDILDDIKFVYDMARKGFEAVPIFLFGHSLGGLNALMFAWHRASETQFAGVIASSPAVRPGFEPPAAKVFFGNLLKGIPVVNSVTVANELDLNCLSHDPQVIAAYKADPLVHGYVSLRTAGYIINEGNTLLTTGFSHFTKPIMIVHGTADVLTSCPASVKFADLVPATDKTCKTYEGAFHELHNEPAVRDELIKNYAEWMLKHI